MIRFVILNVILAITAATGATQQSATNYAGPAPCSILVPDGPMPEPNPLPWPPTESDLSVRG